MATSEPLKLDLNELFNSPFMMAQCDSPAKLMDGKKGWMVLHVFARRGLLPFIGREFEFSGERWAIKGEWQTKPADLGMWGSMLETRMRNGLRDMLYGLRDKCVPVPGNIEENA